MHIIERVEEKSYAFVTCNTGEGVEYHPSNQSEYPKTKARTAIRRRYPSRANTRRGGVVCSLQANAASTKGKRTESFLRSTFPYLANGGNSKDGGLLNQAVHASGDLNGDLRRCSGPERATFDAYCALSLHDEAGRIRSSSTQTIDAASHRIFGLVEKHLGMSEHLVTLTSRSSWSNRVRSNCAGRCQIATREPDAMPTEYLRSIRDQVENVRSIAKKVNPKPFVPVVTLR